MRASGLSSGLERALSEFVDAAARALRADVAAGAEVELELYAQRGRARGRTPLYSYRPLTDAFIAEREPLLARLPEYAAAVHALGAFDGLDRYLGGADGGWRDARERELRVRRCDRAAMPEQTRADAQTRARSALRELLADVFAEQTDFVLRPGRLAAAFARLESAEPARAAGAVTLIATLHGMTIAADEIKLTQGFTIATPAALSWAPDVALSGWETMPDGVETAHLLIALTCQEAAQSPDQSAAAEGTRWPAEDVIAHGREVLADLLRALRLFGDGRVTLGPLAWARAAGERRWSTVPLGVSGRPHGMLVVAAEQEDELRAFCNLVSRRAPHGNELAWALRRFELGCERPSAYEGLSDHLLALRVLLEPEGPSSGLLAGRIAVLCALPDDRAKLTERISKAQALERAIVAGSAKQRAAGLALARDVADYLRALLRDVICGHLSPGLVRLADELAAAPAQEREATPDAPASPAQQALIDA